MSQIHNCHPLCHASSLSRYFASIFMNFNVVFIIACLTDLILQLYFGLYTVKTVIFLIHVLCS